VFGDADCNGSVDSRDALWVIRGVARLLPEGGGSDVDVDCDADSDAVDALKILRYLAGLPVTQNQPCPEIGA
jgi:hypothetical protein